MEPCDVIWLTTFSLLFLVLSLIHYLVINSFHSKPSGHGSIFDLALKDSFIVSFGLGTWVCLIDIISRFEAIKTYLLWNHQLLIIFCSITTFLNTSFCVICCCLCVIRIVCLFKKTILEESDSKIRFFYIALTITSGVNFTNILRTHFHMKVFFAFFSSYSLA